jgi:hypothetical protein
VTTIRVFYDKHGFPFATEINDSSTPKLQHVTAIICSALTAVPFGSGAIAGTVTDAATGEPIRDVCAVSYTPDGTFENVDGTDATGSYRIPLLASGPHKVLFFSGCQSGLYRDEWYDDRPSLEQASIAAGIHRLVTDEARSAASRRRESGLEPFSAQLIAMADTDEVIRLRLLRAIAISTYGCLAD